MPTPIKVLVTGAGGFIGHHLVTFLRKQGYWARGVDLKGPGFAPTDADEFELLDLRRWDNCLRATRGVEEVYALAADMGGMGFISANHAQILRNNSLISIHTLDAARENGIRRYLYTSSACIYPEYKQLDTNVIPLKEEDAYPAQPQDAYGWEKLVTERLCTHYREEFGTKALRVLFLFSSEYGFNAQARIARCMALCTRLEVTFIRFAPLQVFLAAAPDQRIFAPIWHQPKCGERTTLF